MSFENRWVEEKASDARSNEHLIEALRSESDDDEYNDMLTILQARRDPLLIRKAQVMCKSTDPIDRSIGAGILGQNGAGEGKILKEECIEALLDRANHDHDADVLSAASFALDDYEDPRIPTSLARLKKYPDEGVRYAVVHSLLGRKDGVSIETLVELSSDPDTDVRNRATFGLSQQIDADSPEIREALLRRVEDSNSEIRAEALLGLARRDDSRAVELLLREFEAIAEADNYWDMVFEGAMELGDSRLYPGLLALKEEDIENEWFEKAIAACRIPGTEEGMDPPDGADTTCPVCGFRNAFPEPGVGFCRRCGWQSSVDQLEAPNLVGNRNRRSLNQERQRWQQRLEAAGR